MIDAMMDCKLCLKRFSNGKALGAHMRSHYAILPLPGKSSSPDPGLHSFKRRRRDQEEEAAAEAAEMEMEMEEGDVALCLIMLSRDAWSDSGGGKGKIHRCEKCGKVFKSSQGLGSHKASHFKRRFKESDESVAIGGNQLHECEFCPRTFKSAQALGGHKRSHFPPRNLVDLNLPPAIGVVNEEILA